MSPAIRRKTWCSSPPSRSAARAAVEAAGGGHRRWRPGDAGGRALASRTASSTTPPLLLDGGKIAGNRRFKCDLPNYGVFDEKRVFAPGPPPGPMIFRGVRLGVMVCEDMWKPDVTECLAETGAEILCVPNGSPL